MISELMNSIFPWKAYAKQSIVSSLSGNIGNWVEGIKTSPTCLCSKDDSTSIPFSWWEIHGISK